jgi:DNA repair exonuclease SbcCD nuclease subunit
MDFHRAFEFVIRDAAKRELDALIVSGDVIDTTRPTPHTIKLLQHLHRVARSLKLRVLMISGNHDRTNPHWSSVLDLEGSYGFELIDNEAFEITGKDGENLKGYGLPYMSEDHLLEALEILHEAEEDYDILVWHGMVRGLQGARTEELDVNHFLSQFRLTLLGDIHIRQYIEQGNRLIGYPGSTELCSSSEPADKSYEIIEVNGDKTEHYPVSIPTRPVYIQKVDSIESADRFIDQLRQHKGEAPLVFVKHAAEIVGLRDRVKESLPEDSIIQVQKMPKNIDMMSAIDFDTDMTPEDFLTHFFPEGSELHSTAKRLLIEDVVISDVLEEFIKNQTERYAAEEDKD